MLYDFIGSKSSLARDAVSSCPGGHDEGFPETFKQLYAKVYEHIFAGDPSKTPDFPTFADGRHETQLFEAIQRSACDRPWVKVR
ncbi:MAG: hypothetical protein ACM3MF_05910 [Anaerolineae bacterium]